jgi:hypothetical protein
MLNAQCSMLNEEAEAEKPDHYTPCSSNLPFLNLWRQFATLAPVVIQSEFLFDAGACEQRAYPPKAPKQSALVGEARGLFLRRMQATAEDAPAPGDQAGLDFNADPSQKGHIQWLNGRRLAVAEWARRLGLPLGRQVEVWQEAFGCEAN